MNYPQYINMNKSLNKELMKVYGINHFKSNLILKKMGVNNKNQKKITANTIHNLILDKQFEKLASTFKNSTGETLKLKEIFHIKLLMNIKSRKGFCHKFNIPVHGQRTKTNAKTQKKLSPQRLIMSNITNIWF